MLLVGVERLRPVSCCNPYLQGAPGEAAVMEAATGADEELPAASAMESNGWRLSPDGDAAILDGKL